MHGLRGTFCKTAATFLGALALAACGSGSSSADGGGNVLNCNNSCVGKVGACGLSSGAVTQKCAAFCADSPSDYQISCMAALPCSEIQQLEKCLTDSSTPDASTHH